MIEEYWQAHRGRLTDKWAHYLPIYDRHFSKFRNRECRMLEIGVSHGGSLQLWKAYFGPLMDIWGLDIDPRCSEYEEDGIHIIIGDQSDETLLRLLGSFDVVIDDGSHFLSDQATALRILWPALKDNGVYLVEDCHNERPEPPRDAGSISYYPWVSVFEKFYVKPERIVTGHPSRPLNEHELAAYAKHLHP